MMESDGVSNMMERAWRVGELRAKKYFDWNLMEIPILEVVLLTEMLYCWEGKRYRPDRAGGWYLIIGLRESYVETW